MNDAQVHITRALQTLAAALQDLDEAAACIRAQPALKDMDARALSVARTHLETAELWAERARG
jgi:hypothetical protein